MQLLIELNLDNRAQLCYFLSLSQYVNPELYGLKKYGGGNRRGGGRGYGQQYGTFKKGSFGQKSNGYGDRNGGGGGGFKSGGYGGGAGGGSRFSDRNGGDSRNGGAAFSSTGHTRFT